MSDYTYNGIKIKQQPKGPTLYLTKIPARELLKWADVPRKRSDFQAGYQRQLTESRTSNIKDFLELDPNNLIPGALLVSVDEDFLDISGVQDDFVSLKIKSRSNGDLEDLIAETYSDFYSRLGQNERKFADGELDVDIENLEEGSLLPSSYLAELTRELKQAKEDFSELPEERQGAVEEYVRGMSRPGRILDGQHRVFGAKNVPSFDVNFPVVLMPGLSESEQVFHFFVVNNKAKPLKPVELRSTISTSLTDQEIDNLYQRFRAANVKAEKAKLTYRTNRNPNSPFRGLIDFGLDEEASFIPENVANQLVSKFVGMPKRFRPLYEDVDDWNQDPEYDYRLTTFFAFWRAIKEMYPEAWQKGIEENGSPLFYKVTLLKLQELVLERLVPMNELKKTSMEADSVLGDHDSLNEVIKIILAQLPEEFFLREWQEKVSDSSQFREFLKEQMEKAMSGSDVGRLKLFRKSS